MLLHRVLAIKATDYGMLVGPDGSAYNIKWDALPSDDQPTLNIVSLLNVRRLPNGTDLWQKRTTIASLGAQGSRLCQLENYALQSNYICSGRGTYGSTA